MTKKRERSNAPLVRVTATAKTRLDEIRALLKRPLSYAQLIDELARERLAQLKRGDDGGEWVYPHRQK